MIRVVSAAILAVCLQLASLARAQDPPVPAPSPIVLLLADADPGVTTARLRAELEALGFRVAVRSATGPPDRAAMESATKSAGAAAALRVLRSTNGVEVWVVDRVTGKTVLREIVLPGGEDHELVAVRAVELLRASLLEVDAGHAPRGEVAVTPEVRALVADPPQEPARWFLGLQGGLQVSVGGLDPSGLLALSASFRPHDYLEAELTLMAPILPSQLSAAEGTMSSVISAAALGGRAFVAHPSSVWNFYGGPALGFVWLHLEGTAQPPYRGVSDDILSPALFLRTGAYVSASRAIRFVLDTDLAIALQRPQIRFGGREVAAWGRPAFVGAVGVEVGLD